MNIFDKGFAPAEATLRYLDGDYVVLKPGSFVRCAAYADYPPDDPYSVFMEKRLA